MANGNFKHRALELVGKKAIVYPALSKRRFYMRMLISKYILENDGVPLNPFMVFDYFLADAVDRDIVRQANNNIVAIADEVWVFGEVSNGVLAEVIQAKQAGKPVRYFAVENDRDFEEIAVTQVVLEEDVADRRNDL